MFRRVSIDRVQRSRACHRQPWYGHYPGFHSFGGLRLPTTFIVTRSICWQQMPTPQLLAESGWAARQHRGESHCSAG